MTFVVVILLFVFFFPSLIRIVAENYKGKEIPCPWGTTNSLLYNSHQENSDLLALTTDSMLIAVLHRNDLESGSSLSVLDLVLEKIFASLRV
jgi:hypothetical protein